MKDKKIKVYPTPVLSGNSIPSAINEAKKGGRYRDIALARLAGLSAAVVTFEEAIKKGGEKDKLIEWFLDECREYMIYPEDVALSRVD